MSTTKELIPPYTAINKIETAWKNFGDREFYTAICKVPSDVTYKGSILIVHGFAEFAELYYEVLDKFASAGYEVYYFDQRGSGHTSLKDDSKGKTNETLVFLDLDNVIEYRLQQIKNNPNQKLYLLGHSMGGGIILNYLVIGKHKESISGVLCSAPEIDLAAPTKPNIVLRAIMPFISKLLPNFKVDSALQVEHVTTDKDWADFLVNNSYISQAIGSASLFHGMISRGLRLLDMNFVKDIEKDVPILICHGSNDKINDYYGSEKFVKLTPSKDVKLEEFKDTEHSLLVEKEPIRSKVMNFMIQWLENH